MQQKENVWKGPSNRSRSPPVKDGTRENMHIPSALSASSLGHQRQEFQVRETVRHEPRLGRPGTSNADVARIEDALPENLEKSLRFASAKLGTPFSTIRKFLYEKLRVFPYKVSFLQQLLPEDYPRRLTYAQHVCLDLRNGLSYLNAIALSG